MLGDDDLKFSIGEIMDLCTELFGEKVEKVDAQRAKEILKRESENFLSEVMSAVSAPTLSDEEKALVDAYELEKLGASELMLDIEAPKQQAAAPAAAAEKAPDTDIDDLKREIEERSRQRLEQSQKLAEADAIASEAARKKREELLKRIEDNERRMAQEAAQKASVQQQMPAPKAESAAISYNDIIPLVKLFEDSQKIFAAVLSKLIKKKAVTIMFQKTLQKAMKKHQAVLKKADTDSRGCVKDDGSLEPARIFSNINAANAGASKRDDFFFGALRDIFEERIIATEIATSFETKDEIISNVYIQTDKYFGTSAVNPRLKKVFFGKIFPDTTLKPGE